MAMTTTSTCTATCDLCGDSVTQYEFPDQWFQVCNGFSGTILNFTGAGKYNSNVKMTICPTCISPLLEQAEQRKKETA
jgi:hypothetical protein